MGCHLEKGYVVCWACGPQNRVETLSILTGLPPAKCYSLLGGLDFEQARHLPVRGKLIIPEGLNGGLMRQHREYLRSRNIDPKVAETLWRADGFRGTASGGMAWRIFIPIYLEGRCLSWTTRATSDGVKNRYMSAPTQSECVAAKSLLYGEDYVGNSMLILEGPLDVWRVGPGAVATLGVGVSRAQVSRIAKCPRRVVCMDNTPDGRRKARELCAALEGFPGETLDVQLDAKDPGEASERELEKLRRLI